tara:strand:+ start:89 stop:475 length:387 start_codon:yes stop_codon:yes gene_type:complete
MIGELMKINPTGKSSQSFNSLHAKQQPRPYDNVMLYCRYCQTRIEIKVYHPTAQLEHYQLINLPERIARHMEDRKVHCKNCDRDFLLEKQHKEERFDFHMKLDCSNMKPGMESWYEDAIPKYSTDTYA